MSGPSGSPERIAAASQVYVDARDVEPEPEQSAIYRNICFSVDRQTLYGICVTPQCEFGKKRVLYLTFCRLIPFDLFFELHLKGQRLTVEQLECSVDPTVKLLKRTKNIVDNFVDQFILNRAHRYHFLPGNGVFGNSFVDFQVIECIKFDSLDPSDKVAVLTSPFRQELPVRYSFYQGRIGTLAYDDAVIRSVILSVDLPLIKRTYT